ncbi:DUF983 domain-containing protein [Citreimonas sp.]|uniref:DUF983 domain-containing protein n=1 Tax=Citreimonas sp. TaxID=3036715 RepID=UPI0040584CAC
MTEPHHSAAAPSVAPSAEDEARDTAAPVAETAEGVDEERPTWPALLKGWHRRCPRCGSGPMLSGYLKVRDHCPVCREPLHHHRADDGPAYLTILIVGHLMAPLLHVGFTAFRPDPLVLFTFFAVGCVGLSLYLLPRLKGALVAFQWARHMHGFARPQ